MFVQVEAEGNQTIIKSQSEVKITPRENFSSARKCFQWFCM